MRRRSWCLKNEVGVAEWRAAKKCRVTGDRGKLPKLINVNQVEFR